MEMNQDDIKREIKKILDVLICQNYLFLMEEFQR